MDICSDGSAGQRKVSIHYPSPTLGTPAAAQVAPWVVPVILSSMGVGMQGLCCLCAAPQPWWRLEKACCFLFIYFCEPWPARPCLTISAVSPVTHGKLVPSHRAKQQQCLEPARAACRWTSPPSSKTSRSNLQWALLCRLSAVVFPLSPRSAWPAH